MPDETMHFYVMVHYSHHLFFICSSLCSSLFSLKSFLDAFLSVSSLKYSVYSPSLSFAQSTLTRCCAPFLHSHYLMCSDHTPFNVAVPRISVCSAVTRCGRHIIGTPKRLRCVWQGNSIALSTHHIVTHRDRKVLCSIDRAHSIMRPPVGMLTNF